jgi:hypothetical protein
VHHECTIISSKLELLINGERLDVLFDCWFVLFHLGTSI